MYYSPRREHHFKALTIDDLRHSPRVLECTEKQHRARHYILSISWVYVFSTKLQIMHRAQRPVFFGPEKVSIGLVARPCGARYNSQQSAAC